jgi:hypothetical protein
MIKIGSESPDYTPEKLEVELLLILQVSLSVTVDSPQNLTFFGSRQTRRIENLSYISGPQANCMTARSSPQESVILRACPNQGCPIWGLSIVLTDSSTCKWSNLKIAGPLISNQSRPPLKCPPVSNNIHTNSLPGRRNPG